MTRTGNKDPKGNPHDDSDGGRSGEDHTKNSDGTDHHTLYRGGSDPSHISWDTDKDGDYEKGSGHTTDHDTKEITPWDK